MSLEDGAKTIINQCLDISQEEKVVLVNDGNDRELIDSLRRVLDEQVQDYEYIEYEELENHGEEPPENVAEAMKNSDVFIAPTLKSLSHTQARVKACEKGARGATLPGITREVWETSLQADYSRVKEISDTVYEMMEKTSEVRIETSSGTYLTFEIDIEYFHRDTGLIHNSGEFGNLPAGEADGAPVNVNGTLVIDHLLPAPDSEGTEIEIRDSEVVATESEDYNTLEKKFDEVDGARNVAEFGFGTNPEATLIGNLLQDEKVLGTVHIAFGDNSSYVPEGDNRRVEAGIHWDAVCIEPTVYFDGRKVIDMGEPVFLDNH